MRNLLNINISYGSDVPVPMTRDVNHLYTIKKWHVHQERYI